MSGAAARQAVSALGHDVGKYIARVARNVGSLEGSLPPALQAMLLADLYGSDGKARASVRFEALLGDGAALPSLAPPLSEVRARLEEIDALEAAVRGAEPAGVARAVLLALEVSDAIGEWTRALAAEEPDEL